jgi:hypothetical protein
MAAVTFNWVNVGTPFSWYFVAALLFGAAVARATRRDLGGERWTLVFIYLSFSVALAAGGVFVPGPRLFLDPRLGYLSVAAAFLGFFGFRYKIWVGIPVALVATILIMLLGFNLRGWTPLFASPARIARVHVFDVGRKRVDLEVTPKGGAQAGTPVTGTLPEGSVAPVVEILRFSSYYFFLSSPMLYRLDGITTAGRGTASYELSVIDRKQESIPITASLPGILRTRIIGQGVQPKALQDYRVELLENLTARMVEVSS